MRLIALLSSMHLARVSYLTAAAAAAARGELGRGGEGGEDHSGQTSRVKISGGNHASDRGRSASDQRNFKNTPIYACSECE